MSGYVSISRAGINAIDAALDLAADVLNGETPATTEECHELAMELCKARGVVLEAKDHAEQSQGNG